MGVMQELEKQLASLSQSEKAQVLPSGSRAMSVAPIPESRARPEYAAGNRA